VIVAALASLVSLLGGLAFHDPFFKYISGEVDSEEDPSEWGPDGWGSRVCEDAEEPCEGEEVPDEVVDDLVYGDHSMAPWKQWHRVYVQRNTKTKKSAM
jgi:hypothetical protein